MTITGFTLDGDNPGLASGVVRGNQSSIAIFNFGGTGTIASNTVSEANDAIASNDSHGVSFLNNTILASGRAMSRPRSQATGSRGARRVSSSMSRAAERRT